MNILRKKTIIICSLILVFGIVILWSCEEESDSEFSSEVEFYKYNQLSNIYDNEIFPLTERFTSETVLLEELVKVFQQEISASNLKLVQDQWKAVQLVWKRLELYDLGNVADSFLAFKISRWPTDPTRIEVNIAGAENINEDFIASIGSSSKGISGIEYLIFSAEDDDTVLNRFINEDNADRRMQYLVALSENLNTKTMALQTLWESNKSQFVNGLENGISGSQNQVINAMVTLIEEIIISKLGNPLGDSNGGIIEPERLEGYRSTFSKDEIQQHLTALERCYKGDFAQTPFRVGFDDFLDLIEMDGIALKINDQFKECQLKLDAISGSLENEMASNPESVIALKNSFRDLLVLVKVDMANVLGSTITFNDNDGD